MIVFSEGLLLTIQNLVVQHHTVYPTLPPQGVFFEALVQRAFHLSGSPDAKVVSSTPNAPTFDLVAANRRFSVKTETGKGTRQTLTGSPSCARPNGNPGPARCWLSECWNTCLGIIT